MPLQFSNNDSLMLPVAVTCSNTFVLKPSEKDPSRGGSVGSKFRMSLGLLVATTVNCVDDTGWTSLFRGNFINVVRVTSNKAIEFISVEIGESTLLHIEFHECELYGGQLLCWMNMNFFLSHLL
ncbi:unnamed protein product [Lactuca saligna]|uniref:Uncharacterized protein n=1 Tax=Lactuca saligna TaxID=75948 RepID=A0AA36A4Y0_LACSI|nr:unnamed protein product [Lactuca saligna]